MASAPRASIISRTKHEQMLDEMHSALHALGDLVRKPYPREGDKLLPSSMSPDMPGAESARKHIEMLHSVFKAAKSAKEK